MYKVKTRNWYEKNWTRKLLELSCKGQYDKYLVYTTNPLRAWATWAYWMLLKPFTGGWTYILFPNARPDGQYKAVYR